MHATVCVSLPGQGWPPLLGLGLSQVRLCCKVPAPHVALHAVALAQSDQPPSPGHGAFEHATVRSSLPGQGNPPLLGLGLSQVRRCSNLPSPHVAPHAVALPQSDQPPSTGHGAFEHATVCVSLPGQGWPPLLGLGLSQVRVCCKVPAPHVAPHAVALTQSDQPPSTGHGACMHATVCVSLPGQGWPPLLGLGLSQVRVCCKVPSPHVAPHAVALTQSDQPPSTGHGACMHATVCVSLPGQGWPPLLGLGLSQVRVCCKVPAPHVAPHAVALTQSDQPPLTVTERNDAGLR
jgi:hypothetical protein